MEAHRYTLIVFFLTFSIHLVSAQETLCVFKTSPNIVNSASPTKALGKGTLIHTSDVITLKNGDMLSLIDKNGSLYKIDASGKYTYKQLISHKVEGDKSSLTSKYFKYLWEEMTHASGSETIIGGVFRGENLMRFPIDSALVVSSKVKFTWDIDSASTTYYFFLRNIETHTLLRLATNGSEVSLFKENPIFNTGNSFEWFVDTEAFPNLDNKTFHGFTLIDRTAYESKKEEFKSVIKELKIAGLTDQEIEQILCETYGLCK